MVMFPLVSSLASCGLLMDFEPGSDGNGGGSASSGASTSSSIANGPAAAQSSQAVQASATTSSGSGGEGGSGTGAGDPGLPRWSSTFGGEGDQRIHEMAVSPMGRVAVAGTFSTELHFGDSHLEGDPGTVTSFVALYDPAGTPIWARSFGTYDPNAAPAQLDFVHVGFAADEHLHVSGSFTHTVILEDPAPDADPPDPGTQFSSTGGPDLFAASYDLNGVFAWGYRYGGENADPKTNGGSYVRRDGHTIMVGSFCGTLVGCPSSPQVSCEDEAKRANVDIFVLEIDDVGNCLYARSYGALTSTEDAFAVAAADDRVAIVGSHNGDLSFGGAPISPEQPLMRSTFVAALGPSGVGEAALSLHQDVAASVMFDDGNVRFSGAIGLPLRGKGAREAQGMLDFVAAQLVPGNDFSVDTVFGGGDDDHGFLRLAPDGSLRAYGDFFGIGHFGEVDHPSDEARDAFIASLDGAQPRDGIVEVFGDAGDQVIVGAGFDDSRFEVIAGNFQNGFTVDGRQLQTSDGTDVFVVARSKAFP